MNANEVAKIENSITLLIKNGNKYYEMFYLDFNPTNHKLLFMPVISTTKEALDYIKQFYKN